jgi:hypothetical protein
LQTNDETVFRALRAEPAAQLIHDDLCGDRAMARGKLHKHASLRMRGSLELTSASLG